MMIDVQSAAQDPVCGTAVERSTAPSVMISGKKFYFCSDACRVRFLAQAEDAEHHEDYHG